MLRQRACSASTWPADMPLPAVSPSCQQVTMAPAGTVAAKVRSCASSEPESSLPISGLMLITGNAAAAGIG